MPRGSGGSSAKRQGLHHSHSNNVIVSPKRPVRSRSSTLNVISSTTQASASSPHEVSAPPTQFHPTTNGTNGWHGGKEATGERCYECLDDGADAYDREGANGTVTTIGGEHRKIEISHSVRPPLDAGTSTVLSSFPLLDTITLLIIFLQLPSAVLTVIHFLYALQTFVPPSTTLLSASTPSSFPSFSSLLLQGSNGSPALLTIIFADVVVALISMFLWPPARTFLVDFAQAVIAISFGAGSESGSASKNAAVCAGLMSGIKVITDRFKISDTWSTIQPATRQHNLSFVFAGRVEPVSWARNAIAIHIVAQWGMQILRRWLLNTPDLSESSTSVLPSSNARDGTLKQKDKDPEAAVASSQILERDNSVSGGKRKRKNQAQLIRNTQPMWATIANMIVHLTKEIERSRALTEAQGAHLEGGVAAAASETMPGNEQVWISKIGSNEIEFIAGFVGSGDGREGYGMHGNGSADGPGNDNSFPFFVRVNGIVWPQTEIYRLADTRIDELGDEAIDSVLSRAEEWAVEVTGLTGSTEYDFEFVKSNGGASFYMTSACTLSAQASSTIPARSNNSQSSRPLSPITTLLHSLAQANSCLTDTKASLKTARKAHKSGLSEIRKDIEKHRALLGTNDSANERSIRKNLALREGAKRAEEEADSNNVKLEILNQEPDRLRPEWQTKKKQWQTEKQRLKEAQAQAAAEKAKADRQASAVESEIASLTAKKEKLATRLQKLRQDYGKLPSDSTISDDNRGLKSTERELAAQRRERLEKEFVDAITRLERRISEFNAKTHENWVTYYALESAAALQLQMDMTPQPAPPAAAVGFFGSIAPPPGIGDLRDRTSGLPELGGGFGMSVFGSNLGIGMDRKRSG